MTPDEARAVLNAEWCICGRKKEKGNAFDFSCYRLLGPEKRFDLRRPVGKGFESAYSAAKASITAHYRQ